MPPRIGMLYRFSNRFVYHWNNAERCVIVSGLERSSNLLRDHSAVSTEPIVFVGGCAGPGRLRLHPRTAPNRPLQLRTPARGRPLASPVRSVYPPASLHRARSGASAFRVAGTPSPPSRFFGHAAPRRSPLDD